MGATALCSLLFALCSSSQRAAISAAVAIHTMCSGLMLLLIVNIVMMLEKLPQHAVIAGQQTARQEEQHDAAPELAAAAQEADQQRDERHRAEVEIATRHQDEKRCRQPLGWNPRDWNHRERKQRARGAMRSSSCDEREGRLRTMRATSTPPRVTRRSAARRCARCRPPLDVRPTA